MKMKKTNEELMKLALEYVQQAEQDAQMNPTGDSIQVVIVEPARAPYKKTIPNTLEAMQEIVGGYIEIVNIGHTETGGTIAIVVNEEGKIINLPMNRIINGRGGSDILVGTFFMIAYNMKGDNVSLNDAECEKLMKQFKRMDVYL